MNKIAIITLNGYFNYGNRLQNYAVQEVLKSYGYEVETILIENDHKERVNNRIKNKTNKMSIGQFLNKARRKIYLLSNKKSLSRSREKRTGIFKDFSKQFINETNYTIVNNGISNEIIQQYSYFVTGSDQVWNPNYISEGSVYFLDFAPKGQRISFSASFGVSVLPEECKINYEKWISGIDYLSVREEAGAKIINDLTGRKAEVLLDPTMMLTKEKWLAAAKKPIHVPERYLLTYFLGGVPKEYDGRIKKIARENNLKIVHLSNLNDIKAYETGPSEFIEYINSADLFITDSFHGAVFSILLETPFLVTRRKGNSPSMYSRVETLLNKFKLVSREIDNINDKDLFNVDFSHIPSILEKERNKTRKFLREAIVTEVK